MQDVGKVQVALVLREFTTSDRGNAVVEMGALGQAVKLLAIHYILTDMGSEVSYGLEAGLSSNPENTGYPMATSPLPILDPSVYGYVDVTMIFKTAVGYQVRSPVAIIPLYGLVRPRRQILIWEWLAGAAKMRAEIYYQPISLVTDDLNALNLKYGKYRRSA